MIHQFVYFFTLVQKVGQERKILEILKARDAMKMNTEWTWDVKEKLENI